MFPVRLPGSCGNCHAWCRRKKNTHAIYLHSLDFICWQLSILRGSWVLILWSILPNVGSCDNWFGILWPPRCITIKYRLTPASISKMHTFFGISVPKFKPCILLTFKVHFRARIKPLETYFWRPLQPSRSIFWDAHDLFFEPFSACLGRPNIRCFWEVLDPWSGIS